MEIAAKSNVHKKKNSSKYQTSPALQAKLDQIKADADAYIKSVASSFAVAAPPMPVPVPVPVPPPSAPLPSLSLLSASASASVSMSLN